MGFSLACSMDPIEPDRRLDEKALLLKDSPIRGIELWDATVHDPDGVSRTLRESGLSLVNFSGNRVHSLLRREERPGLMRELEANLERAKRWSCGRLMLLSDPLEPDGSVAPERRDRSADAFNDLVENLKSAARLAGAWEVELTLEPLNTRIDHPGYFLDSSRLAFEAVRRVGSPYLKVLYDIYHMAVMGEDVAGDLRENLVWVGHIHAADHPGRHQPGTGGVPYRELATLLRDLGYGGWVGLEFHPLGDARAAVRQGAAQFAPAEGKDQP